MVKESKGIPFKLDDVTVMWYKLDKPDQKYGHYQISFVLTEQKDIDFFKTKSKKQLKDMENGKMITINVKDPSKLQIVDAKRKPLLDVKNVSNGSVVNVSGIVLDTRYGPAVYLNGIQFVKFEKYQGNSDMFNEVEGFTKEDGLDDEIPF